ncbi:MAG: dockerin type I domain-containing protein [Methylococcales bacterium]
MKDINYQPFGAAQSWTYGNGAKTSRSFDLDGWLIGYDLADRIVNYKDSDLNFDQRFSYDAVNRLTGFNTPSSQSLFSYDANGNRTQLDLNGKIQKSTLDSNSNRLLGISNTNPAKHYSYDAAGNITSDGKTQFIYDGRGRLVQDIGSFGQEQYRINGLGQRIAKISGNDLSGDANQDGSITATDLRLIVLMVQGSQPVNLAADCNHDGKVTNADATCAQAKMADIRVNPSKYLQTATYFVYDEAGHLLGNTIKLAELFRRRFG